MTFDLDKKEQARAEVFYEKHRHHGDTLVRFALPGIGVLITVKCDHCGAVEDITDYEIW